jgi:hypothetical protein
MYYGCGRLYQFIPYLNAIRGRHTLEKQSIRICNIMVLHFVLLNNKLIGCSKKASIDLLNQAAKIVDNICRSESDDRSSIYYLILILSWGVISCQDLVMSCQ